MDNGKMIREMEEVNKYGKMDLFMKVLLMMIWRMDKAD